MKAIVTGGSGFLGSHVADVLAEGGHDVTVVDLAPTSAHRSVVADLDDAEALIAAFRGADAICHLAAVGDVYLAGQRPPLAAQANVTGTANVCDAALAAGVARVVYASTWEVYGPPQYQPMDEEHPCNPDHPYNITKLAGERLALAYGRLREGLSVTALRLGTAYGTRMRPNSVICVFIRRAMAREPIVIQGNGEQGRQFTHARDIGHAFGLAASKGANGAVYNTAAKETITIRQLADIVAAELPTTIEFAAARKADVPSALVTSMRIRRDLGWEARVRFATALRELIAVEKAAAAV
jgi:UDP-glucose 4-epimerase